MAKSGFGYNYSQSRYDCLKFAPYHTIWDDSRTDCLKPTLDVFRMKLEGGKVVSSAALARKEWPRWWYLEENMYPLRDYKFEDMTLKGCGNPYEYLERMYPDWEVPDPTYGPESNRRADE